MGVYYFILIVLIVSIFLRLQQHIETFNPKSSLKNFDVTERIPPNIIYNYRYLAKYYLYIIYQGLIQWELHHNGKLNEQEPNLDLKYTIVELKHIPKIHRDKILNIVSYLKLLLNTSPEILKIEEISTVLDDVDDKKRYLIRFEKTDHYDKQKYYPHETYNITRGAISPQKYYPHDTENNMKIAKHGPLWRLLDSPMYLEIQGDKVTNIGLAGLPKFVNYPASIGMGKDEIYADAFAEVGITQPDSVVNGILRDKLEDRINQQLSHCFFPGKDLPERISGIIECKVKGGIWDRMCTKDEECPFYKHNKRFGGCNHATGYCQLPKGMEHLSYKVANPETKPFCHNCPHGVHGKNSLGQCCDEQSPPNYKFYGVGGAPRAQPLRGIV